MEAGSTSSAKRFMPGREVLVLSIFGDEANVLAAIDAGAGGYLLKTAAVRFETICSACAVAVRRYRRALLEP